MEEDGDGEDLTPFWVQSTGNLRRGDRLRRGVSSVVFSSGVVVLLLLVTAVFFLVFVVPSTLSFSAHHIFKPNSVKKSWDSLNIVLVLVAVIFGFLSRNKNEDHKYPENYDELQDSLSKENKSQISNPSTPTNKWYNYHTNEGQKSNLSQWYEDSDYQPKLERKNSILKRNSSSYPDLREFSSSHWSYGDYHRRYYDDFHVEPGRGSDPGRVSDPSQLHRRHRSMEQVDYLRTPPQTKTVIVDTLVSKSSESKNFAPPLPPAVGSQELEENAEVGRNESGESRNERSRRNMEKDSEPMNPVTIVEPPPPSQLPDSQQRAYEGVRRKKERSVRKPEKEREPMSRIAEPSQPPPPPPLPPQRKSSKSDRKTGGTAGSATKDFLNSLYHKKKKKQRQKSVDNFDSLLHEPQVPLSFQLPPPSPPPPPPPPPPSVLQNLFLSKKHKRKRTITVTLAPPNPQPPPPPPPPPRREPARKPEPKSQPATSIIHKPPKAIRMSNFDKLEENSNSGGESPLNRIPPPPPPPPPAFFKSPTWKFVVQGDYVRVNSNNSSRSGSPDPDETDSDVTPSASEGGGATPFHPSPLYCPSPDVNTKAESFITNFRAKLKLEKAHSMRKRDVGLSSLGPGPGPSHI